ncbi:male sterility protein-domain-containing protein [Baffinella frigidus]|nr:male sterility protein-domain-containing protein [Cryptophyta sp. CCMP2293]
MGDHNLAVPHSPAVRGVDDAGDGGSAGAPHAAPSAVNAFLRGKDVLITGGSGFIGKVLMEKVLRSFPSVGRVFVLLRPSRKSGRSAPRRLEEEIAASVCFSRLREMWPAFSERLVPIAGDIGKPLLGMSEEDAALMRDSVSLVFHCAATVKFNEPLETAFRTNVDGTAHLIALCRGMRNLEALVHVSTAYVSPPHSAGCKGHTLEEIRPLKIDALELRQRVAAMSPDEAAAATDAILTEAGFPNTYCLTKAVSEHLLASATGIPRVILRPSIVTCAAREPLPGWTDSLAGPAGLVLAVALGALHTAPGDPCNVVDFVPVDTVVASMLASAWFMASHGGGAPGGGKAAAACARGEPLVVHCSSSGDNPVSWGFMLNAMPGYFERHPSSKTRGAIHFRWARSQAVYSALHAVYHTIPATASDVLAWLRGLKGGTRAKMERLTSLLRPLVFFACHEWLFDASNLGAVRHALNCADRATLDLDVAALCWDTYFTTWSRGMKVFLLQEKPSYVRSRL